MFVPVAADCNMQVALATRKPDRSRFNGVIYHRYPDFDVNNVITELPPIQAATILDPPRYLNVWVIPDIAHGAATFPWDKTATKDGFLSEQQFLELPVLI